MSHSKLTRRGRSLYIEKWNPAAKKYINTCGLCGQRGYSPVIEAADFRSVHWVIFEELSKMMPRMALDEYGRCETCAAIQNKLLHRQ